MPHRILVASTCCFLAGALPIARAQSGAGAATGPGRRGGHRRRSDQDHGRTPRPREIQGHDQGPDAVRRSAAGHRSQPRGHRLDRGAAQELRLHQHRAHQVQTTSRAPRGSRARAAEPRAGARPGVGADAQPATAGGGGRPRGVRARTGVNNDPMTAARREAARAELAADDAGAARRGLLHQDRHDPPRRDVHRRRPHGRPRLGRSGQRRRIGHGARDGAGAHLQQPGRADRALDPLHPLEQRGDRAERRARLRRAAQGAAGQGRSARIGHVPRAEVARA